MRVTVKLFAILRERAGAAAIDLELPPQSTIAAALAQLLESHPELGAHLSKSAVAVNRAYVARDAVLCDGDELALIPPVSGG
jgi:molybdopterin synthase catalytic subunit